MQPEMTAFLYPLIFILENKIINTYYNMNKKLIRLTEGDLHKIVKESVNKILKERLPYKYSNLGYLKKQKELNTKRQKHKTDNEYSGFLPNTTDYSYEKLAMMDDGLDFMGLY